MSEHTFVHNIYYRLVAQCLCLLLIIVLAYFDHNSGPFSGS